MEIKSTEDLINWAKTATMQESTEALIKEAESWKQEVVKYFTNENQMAKAIQVAKIDVVSSEGCGEGQHRRMQGLNVEGVNKIAGVVKAYINEKGIMAAKDSLSDVGNAQSMTDDELYKKIQTHRICCEWVSVLSALCLAWIAKETFPSVWSWISFTCVLAWHSFISGLISHSIKNLKSVGTWVNANICCTCVFVGFIFVCDNGSILLAILAAIVAIIKLTSDAFVCSGEYYGELRRRKGMASDRDKLEL